MPDTRMQNDEPTRDDQLGRSEFARALATIATTSETPLVIGLYGRWGAGKTSLMRIVQSKLDADGETKTVWFDAWRHQFDEHPALGLMHTMVNELGIQESAKCALTTVARALGSWALKATTSLDIGDIEGSLRKYEEQNFKIRDDRTRLYESFEEIVRTAQGTAESTEHRIVFFIDDLDRCLPAHILSVLESLKLFLNIQGCVYFLGVDRHALEGSIRQHYEDCELDEVSYLDKIIQLPFTIPPISEGAARNFIQKLLPDELSNCRPILEAGLGRNPRGIKRFIRTLQLNQALAKRIIPSHRPQVLAALLLIQYSKPELYSDIAGSPGLLYELVSESDKSAQLCEEYLAGDELLLEALRLVDLPDQEILRQYIYLTS
ncbi:MAG: hypothetical protein IH897_03810, partial [Planctomycetes bacterium]|nr:hypothetical protein [Planctomycetota bacterium]